MSKQPKLVDVKAEMRWETANAWKINDGKREDFVPKSLVEWNEEDGTFTMPYWLAKEKGFI